MILVLRIKLFELSNWMSSLDETIKIILPHFEFNCNCEEVNLTLFLIVAVAGEIKMP